MIGRKRGFFDERGQIIFYFAKIIKEIKPKCFILENVKGLVTRDKGATIKIIMSELERYNYNVRYKVLTSLDYGVPQMRQRVYFVGFRKGLKVDFNKFEWTQNVPIQDLKDYFIKDSFVSDERLERLKYYLINPQIKENIQLMILEEWKEKSLILG